MSVSSLIQPLHRAVSLGLLTLGLVAGAGPGCLYPDYCIALGVTGTQICVAFSNATGVTQEQVELPLLDGVGAIKGCDCLWSEEVEVLEGGDPQSPEYQEIVVRLEFAARQRCFEIAVEQAFLNHNCADGALDNGLIETDAHCVAGCVYSKPPPNGECPDECTPKPVAEGDSGGEVESEAGSDSGDEPPLWLLAPIPEEPH